MSDLNTLAGWLRPLVEARKATAEAATQAPWTAKPVVYGPPEDGWGDPRDWEIYAASETVVSHQQYEGGGIHTEADARHIAANDPRQILADCEYHLAELARHDRTHRCDWGDYCFPDRPCTPLKRLARIYRHRDPEGYADLAEDWEP